MLKKIINKGIEPPEKLKSWYDLSKEEAYNLEKDFLKNDMGKEANEAMHICIIIGIITFVFSALAIEFLLISGTITPYNFTIMLILTLLGTLIVVLSTIEYHIKFNSWLKIKHNIIKK